MLFEQTNFGDSSAAQGISGTTCQAAMINARSIAANGRFFVWDQPGCQGARKQFDDAGATDLGGFRVRSVKLR